MATTLGEIKTQVYLLMNQSSDSSTYDADTRVQDKINYVIQEICKGEYRSILSEEVFKAGDLRFLRGKQAITLYDSVTLTSPLLTTDVVANFDTTNYPNSGSFCINGNVIHYTGKNATQVTGVTNVLMDQDEGEIVRQVFKISTEAFKAFVLFNVVGKTQYGLEQVEIPYDDSRNQASKSRYWTILTDETSDTMRIDIRGFTGTEKFWLEYYKSVLDYTNDSDEVIIPDPYSKTVIAPVVAGELLREAEQTEEASRKLQIAYSKLITFYNTYNQLVKERRKSISFQGPSMGCIAPIGFGRLRQDQIFK